MLIAGVDEVGRGPLAGPVVAAAVMLPQDHEILGLTDSKKLSEKKRQQLEEVIKHNATCYAIAELSPAEIDQHNILQASLIAMAKAVAMLSQLPTKVLVDGNKAPKIKHTCTVETIIGGDLTVPSISAASILAKQYRDRLMEAYEAVYPGYGFAQHKGYPTKQHIAALTQLGVTPIHRRSFGPVKKVLNQYSLSSS